jgi:hypothetical protein
MFFIGGFNSVIPYVVYLSLIWTFVIFSFGGKITAILHKSASGDIRPVEYNHHPGDDVLLRCYTYPAPQKDQDHQVVADLHPDDKTFPVQLGCFIKLKASRPHLPELKIPPCQFRGPPQFS